MHGMTAGRRKRRAGAPGLSESLQRSIAAQVIAADRRRPGTIDSLVEAGLVEARYSGFDPSEASDPPRSIREFGRSLTGVLGERPAALALFGLDALDLLGREAIGTSQAIAGSRKDRLAVAYTALAGFGDRAAQDGEAAAAGLLQAHYADVEEAVGRRGGSVAERLGDGHLLAFPAADAAVSAALDLATGASLLLRAGVGAGEVMVFDGHLFGRVLQTAARVARAADGGEVLATAEAQDEAAALPGIAFEFRSPRPLGEGSAPVALWAARRT